MTIREVLEKIFNKNEEEGEDIPDDVTTDRYLRSLRRQRRIQMEEIEKEQLKQQISEFEKNKLRKNVFGMQEQIKKEMIKKAIKNRQSNILKQKKLYLANTKQLRKRQKGHTGAWIGDMGL